MRPRWACPSASSIPDIYEILFDIRKDKHPCALCAKMRRSILCQRAQELGCNKLALAHNREDVLETFLMSLIFEGRLHTFHPKTLMSKTCVTVIRPMVYVPERYVIHMQRELELPILKNPCPANGYTKREEMKQLIYELARRYPTLEESMLGALRNYKQYALWEPAEEED